MNYYEELGVSRSATTAEIQKAYKALVCILHPDQQQDERLRHLSGLQLRRLNQMVEVLTDPAKRSAYDLGLSQPLHPATLPTLPSPGRRGLRVRVRIRFSRRIVAWMFIAFILLASAIVSLRQPAISAAARLDPQPVPPLSEKNPRRAPLSETRIVVQRLAPSKPSIVHRSAETTELRPMFPSAGTPPPIAPSTDSAQRERPVNAPEAGPAPVSISRSATTALTGKWLYVPRDADNPTNFYPAQYIEMQIQDQGGVLRGRYYAKYKVRDRAIWPEMAFRFEGRMDDANPVLTWSSTFGSRGELRLKRVSDESLEVNWVTTEFGRRDVLASGSAVLYRSDP